MNETAIPAVGIGTYDTESDTCRSSVEYALNIGYQHVDTAEMYNNELAVGKAITNSDVSREDVFVATKIHSGNLAYDDVIDHTGACRERLGVDAIDLLYVHWPIRAYDTVDTLTAFDELYDQGLIRHIGLSNFTPELLTEALDQLDAPVFAHQVECHPLLQQDELRKRARTDGHYLVAYSPLAKGAVTEVPELVDIAEKHDVSPAQVSLAWLLSKENVVVIPKSTSENHISENLAAAEIRLDPEDIERIDALERTRRTVDFPAAPWN